MREMTPERLAELRRIAQAATPAQYIATFGPQTVLDLLDEIERLRREREVLAEAVMGWQRYLERDVGTERVHVRTLGAHGRALALLGGEEGGGDDGR